MLQRIASGSSYKRARAAGRRTCLAGRLLAGFWLLCLGGMVPGFSAQLRDGDINPSNLGKGDWIYILPNALNQLGGNVAAVTNLSSLMAYVKNQGMQYLVIKAATSDTLYPSASSPQFTSEVVAAGHAAGLKIFGYNRSYGTNIAGEVAIADYVFGTGADGFVFDAESEWESQNLANNTMLATQLCSTVRARWPNKFLAHSPFAFISVHGSFPYKEFGYYCDAAMPQAYWVEFGYTPSATVTRMNTDWRNWHSGLSGKWTNSIKPIVPAGQGWSGSGTVTPAQIAEFVSALRTNTAPASPGGYNGVNYFRAELHPANTWEAIRTNNIGTAPVGAPVIANVSVSTVSSDSATLTWTTDQSSDSAAEFGLSTTYGAGVTNTTAQYYHTLAISGLSPDTTYHYRVSSKNASAQRGVSGDFVLTTLAVPVADIVLDNPQAVFSGTWAAGSSSSDKYLTNYHYCTAVSGAATKTATYTPNVVVAGKYDVYAWYPAGSNRSTNVPYIISSQNGAVTAYVNQTANGGTWRLLAAARQFAAGSSGTIQIANNTGEGGLSKNVMADGVRLVYVPPAPSAPSIVTPPASLAVNQDNAASFSVVASGTAPLTYQWRFCGTNLPGATASSFTRLNAQPAHEGPYAVVITNSVGAVTSALATLTVRVPPTILAQPQDVTVVAGQDVVFTVTATGTLPLAYQWQFNDVDIPGATRSSLTLTNVQTAQSGSYGVVISNIVAVVPSVEAALNVEPPVIVIPRIQSLVLLPDGTMRLEASGGPGDFVIESAPALTGWTNLATIHAAGAVFQYIDLDTNQPRRFYRVRVLSSP